MSTPPTEWPPGKPRPADMAVFDSDPTVPESGLDETPTVPPGTYESADPDEVDTIPMHETPPETLPPSGKPKPEEMAVLDDTPTVPDGALSAIPEDKAPPKQPPFTPTPKLEALLNERTPIDPDLPPTPIDSELVADHAAWERAKEGTPGEWKRKLKDVVSKFATAIPRSSESATSKAESAERTSKLMARLKGRVVELDAQVAKKIEIGFRRLGETYNRAGWKTKLAVGLTLGIGYGAALGTVSLPAAAVCMLGIAAQRTAGLASMYLKYEKDVALGDERGKQRAMWKAMKYTALMTGGMMLLSEGVKIGIEHHWAGTAQDWLKAHWPGATPHTTAPEHAAAPAVPSSVVQEVPKPEVPHLSVEASPGHGYEYMAKHLWKELQDQHIDPSKFEKGSDIHKLLTADAGSIDRVVHQIAADPTHGFFKPDGTSVRIDLGSHLTIGADGQLHLQTGGADVVRAATGMGTTPVYHPEVAPHVAPPPLTPLSPVHETVTVPPVQAEPQMIPSIGGQHPEVHSVPSRYLDNPLSNAVHTDAAGNPVLEPSAHPPQGVYQGDGRPHEYGNPLTGSGVEPAAPVASPHLESYVTPPTPAERVPTTAPEAHTAPPAPPQPESPLVAPPYTPTQSAIEHMIVNHFHLPVSTTEAHLYADEHAKHILVYGGSHDEQLKAIQRFLSDPAHSQTVVYGTDPSGAYRIPYTLGPDGNWTAGAPARTSGFFGFFSSWMKPPGPEDLKNIIQ